MSFVESGIYRTDNPKYPHYASDGFGRDTYISHNNGGFIEGRPRMNFATTKMLS